MNPIINWKKRTLKWRQWKCSALRKQSDDSKTIEYYAFAWSTQEKPIQEKEFLNYTQNPQDKTELSTIISTITGDMEDSAWINSKLTTTTAIQTEINLKKKALPIEDQIPKEFHEFLDVFLEEKAAQLPESRQWDHKIEMKDIFTPKSFKTYNLTLQEQIELDKFLKENLEKGYIQPSQSPMASPFFFVDKKDGKLWPCQDYQYLNEHTVKNAYPLPLISELLDKLKGACLFTKLNVCWGYNNVQIRDEGSF